MYSSRAIADAAIEFLDDQARQHRGVPFLAHVWFKDPHTPMKASAAQRAAYASEQGLSAGALYQAKTRLRGRGLWPVVPKAHFARVEPTEPPMVMSPLHWRVSLPNGVVVELAGGEVGAVLSAAASLR